MRLTAGADGTQAGTDDLRAKILLSENYKLVEVYAVPRGAVKCREEQRGVTAGGCLLWYNT